MRNNTSSTICRNKFACAETLELFVEIARQGQGATLLLSVSTVENLDAIRDGGNR